MFCEFIDLDFLKWLSFSLLKTRKSWLRRFVWGWRWSIPLVSSTLYANFEKVEPQGWEELIRPQGQRYNHHPHHCLHWEDL